MDLQRITRLLLPVEEHAVSSQLQLEYEVAQDRYWIILAVPVQVVGFVQVLNIAVVEFHAPQE